MHLKLLLLAAALLCGLAAVAAKFDPYGTLEVHRRATAQVSEVARDEPGLLS